MSTRAPSVVAAILRILLLRGTAAALITVSGVVLLATEFAGLGIIVPLISLGTDMGTQGDQANSVLLSIPVLGTATSFALEYPPGERLLLIAALIAAIGIARGVITFVKVYLTSWTVYRLAHDLHERCYRVVLDLPLTGLGERDEGAYYAMLITFPREAATAAVACCTFVVSALHFLGFLSIALAVSLGPALAVLAIAGAAWLLVTRTLLRQIQLSAEALNATVSQFQGWLVETLRGRTVIDAFGLGNLARERYAARAGANFAAICRRERLRSMIEPIGSAIGFLLVASVLAAEALASDDLPARVSELLVFAICLIRLVGPASGMNAALTEVRSYGDSALRVAGFLRSSLKEPKGRVPFTRLQTGIEFTSVTLRYNNAAPPALDAVSLRIEPGEFLALVGPSGSGKSSLASILLQLREPTSGMVTADGIALADYDASSWATHVCFVPQDAFLFNDTIATNIRLGDLNADMSRIERAARRAHAHEFIVRQPDGYDSIVGDGGSRLSGGQRQRVAIARALIREPEVLILDEATSQLDAESERAIGEALDDLRGRCTLLVIAHRLSTVRAADRIAVLSEGRLIDVGSHDALVQRCALYRRLLQLQGYLTIPDANALTISASNDTA